MAVNRKWNAKTKQKNNTHLVSLTEGCLPCSAAEVGIISTHLVQTLEVLASDEPAETSQMKM